MNERFVFIDAEAVKARIADMLAAFSELADDETLRLDTLEGETDLFKVITKALNERFEADSMAEAIKARTSDLYARQKRFERKADAMKKLIKALMDAAGQTKLMLPESTLSIAKGREKIVVDDLEALPQGYFRTERIADKDAIKSVLDAGETIPGAHKETSETSLVVRSR